MKLKLIFGLALAAVGCVIVRAQETFQQAYDDFKQQAQQEYETFRDKANKEYAQWMADAWPWFQVLPPMPKPKDKSLPPIQYDKAQPHRNSTPLPFDSIIDAPLPVEPQPKPLSPIRENQLGQSVFPFVFWGTKSSCRFPTHMKWNVTPFDEKKCAQAWLELSSDNYSNLIRDCLSIRIQHKLCDWAYMLMLKQLCDAKCGKETNESEFLLAFLMCQSGYKVRLACTKSGKILMTFHSNHLIVYGLPRVEINGELFYLSSDLSDEAAVYPVEYPGEKGLSLWISQSPLLEEKKTQPRQIKVEQTPLQINSSVNKNLVDFFSTYPASVSGNDVMSKWGMYANTPMSESVKNNLYPQLRQVISGTSELDAVNILMFWIQYGMVYEYDDNVWGYDRPFFAEETLYYPYCDCEDRAILLSRLVRDLLGLRVILVYYPGHLATAVCFNSNVSGDYIQLNNKKFVIADPTYIGAPVGLTAPDMDNKTAKVILLD